MLLFMKDLVCNILRLFYCVEHVHDVVVSVNLAILVSLHTMAGI